jgi:hypothetical protein
VTKPIKKKKATSQLTKPIEKKKAASQRRGVVRFVERPKRAGMQTISDDLALGYHPHRVGAALPWDHAPHAVDTNWAKLSQDIGPRDSGRGIRSGL